MSDELNKFVLEYIVNTKQSLKELEKLTSKMDDVEKKTNSSGAGLKKFASGAVDEIAKMVPGLEAAKGAVVALTAEFGVALVAVAAVGGAIKPAMDVRNQFNQQRKTGQDVGANPVWVENWRRQFNRASGGRVNADSATDAMKNARHLYNDVYRDPTGIGTEAGKKLRMLGFNIGPNAQKFSEQDWMAQLGQRFQGMSSAQAQGVGMSLGFSADQVASMRKLGGSMNQITDMSVDDVKNYAKGQGDVADYDKAVAELNEHFKEAEQELGEKVIPALTEFVNWLAKITETLPKKVDQTTSAIGGWWNFTKEHPIKGSIAAYGVMQTGLLDMFTGGLFHGDESKKTAQQQADAAKTQAKAAEQSGKTAQDTAAAATKEANALDTTDKDGMDTANQFQRAANLFGAAVASFANAVDERQAWAAWAGEIGRAAGLGSDPKSSRQDQVVAGYNASAKTQYDDIFAAAAKKTGLPVEFIKAIAKNESSFNPNAVSPQGATGIMQVMPSNNASLGITNSKDPYQNIMGGAQLLKQYYDAEGGSLEGAALAYHGGLNTANWGPKGDAYAKSVMATYTSYMAGGIQDPTGTIRPQLAMGYHAGMGESRDKMQLRAVQQNIAARLGLPLGQIQQGDVNKGDVAWASSQLQAGIQNQIVQLQMQLQSQILPQSQRAKIMTDIRDQQMGLQQLKQFSPDVVAGARTGGRSITLGERAIVINVYGVQDGKQVAQQTSDALMTHINDVANGYQDGIAY